MRTYTVTRKKGSKLGEVFYSVGSRSFRFKKGSTTFKDVPELVAVRVNSDYKGDFSVKLNAETAEPEEVFNDDTAFNDNIVVSEEEN